MDDFQTLWEARLLSVALPLIDPAPTPIEGSGVAQFVDDSFISVAVEPLEEYPPRSGFWKCAVVVGYGYKLDEKGDEVSMAWGQILQAFGRGINDSNHLADRLRDEPGRLVIPGGVDAITYDGALEHDPGELIKQFSFTAHLGLLAEPSPI